MSESSVPDYLRRMVVEGEGCTSALLPELVLYLIDALDEHTAALSELTAAVCELRTDTREE